MKAIVTGAGSGIGEAIARAFAEAGGRVLAVDRRPEGLASSDNIRPFVADVISADAPAAIFEACADAWGEPDALINNAGMGNARSLSETDDEALDAYLDVNLRSVFRLSREMVRRRTDIPRSVVNISSVFGQVGFPGSAPYSAAKAGVIGLTRQMAADYGPHGIRVNAIAPGLIATPATADRMQNNPRFRLLTVDQIPAGRAGEAGEIASVALFLCSPAASYVSGQVIAVDGGWTATRYFAG
jgi:3-oxoacyl-[acyl-carrier protein] reductase